MVTTLGCKPNGRNINHDCGALHPEHMAHEVVRRHADIGIALDGDADRLIIADEKGDIVDGDALMALCATRMLKEKRLKKRTVVATVMSNMGLELALAAAGGKLKRTAVGDRYVVEAMRDGGFCFGGEQSGHLVFLDHATTGDGIVAALQALAIMVREERPLSELSKVMTRMPQVLESLTLSAKRPVSDMPRLSKLIEKAEKQLGNQGRVLVRWSGTEAKLRLMLEGPKPEVLQAFVQDMAKAARQDINGA
jgi:phosphoglucosamine mutase